MRHILDSLRLKLFVGTLIGGALFMFIFGRVPDNYVRDSFNDEFHDHATRATKQLLLLAKGESSAYGERMNSLLDQAKAADTEGLIVRVHVHARRGKRGVITASTKRSEIGKPSSPDDSRALFTNKLVFAEEEPGLYEVHRPLKLQDGKKTYLLDMYFSTSERNRQIVLLSNKVNPLRVGALATLLAAILFGGEYFVFRPLRKIKSAAERIAAGDVYAELNIDGSDEIGDLGRSLDSMRLALTTYAGSLEQRLSELTLLYDISKVAGASTDLDVALQVILESAVKALGASKGSAVFDSRPGKKHAAGLALRASYGLEGNDTDAALMGPSSGLVKRVLDSGEPLLVIEGGDADIVAVPIVLAKETIGVLSVGEKQDGSFCDTDTQLLVTLANQTAAVINSSRLFEDLQSSYLSTVQALAGAVDAKDKYTRGHSGRVVKYCQLIAKEIGCSPDDIETFNIAAYLHDLGKIGVDERVLLKTEALSPEDIAHIREHPNLSAAIIKRVKFLERVVPLVKHHHERFDGTGYPDGLMGEAIPLGARILAVADSFDAMTSDRPYRKALSTKVAVDELIGGVGTQFDPDVVAAFLRLTHVEMPKETEKEWHEALLEG